MGISIIKTKLMAFALGATVGSFGGMFFAAKIGSVFPNSMILLVSILVLSLIVLGGMGSIPGVIVGAIVLVGLPEILREFVEYRLLVYGAVLVAIMILRPEGLFPSARRMRELHEEEIEEAQFKERHGEITGAPVITGGPAEDV
jgi:branched-chain amino acid transport system permease protein